MLKDKTKIIVEIYAANSTIDENLYIILWNKKTSKFSDCAVHLDTKTRTFSKIKKTIHWDDIIHSGKYTNIGEHVDIKFYMDLEAIVN